MMLPDDMIILAESLVSKLAARQKKLALAESCTGGLIASAVTSISGSSAIFDRGFVTYSNEAKMDLLGVSQKSLEQYGAVSDQVAGEMATGALRHSQADYSLSVTGIAGPTGGSDEKPVGLVYFGLYGREAAAPLTYREVFVPNPAQIRESIRQQAVRFAINSLIDYINQ